MRNKDRSQTMLEEGRVLTCRGCGAGEGLLHLSLYGLYILLLLGFGSKWWEVSCLHSPVEGFALGKRGANG